MAQVQGNAVSVAGPLPAQVTSPALETEYQALSKNKGNFAFTAKTEGVHKMCFTNTSEDWPHCTILKCRCRIYTPTRRRHPGNSSLNRIQSGC